MKAPGSVILILRSVLARKNVTSRLEYFGSMTTWGEQPGKTHKETTNGSKRSASAGQDHDGQSLPFRREGLRTVDSKLGADVTAIPDGEFGLRLNEDF